KAVSNSPDGFNILWLGCVVLDLFADFFDMYCNGRNVSDRFHVPDFTEQLILGVYMVWMARQECEEIEFFCCKCFFFSVNPHASCCGVNLQSTDFDDFIFFRVASNQSFISCKMCLDSGYQFARTEWFGHIVVGAKT